MESAQTLKPVSFAKDAAIDLVIGTGGIVGHGRQSRDGAPLWSPASLCGRICELRAENGRIASTGVRSKTKESTEKDFARRCLR
jgi:hypothetical protein